MLEKCSIKTETIYNDDKTHRYSLRKVWDHSKPSAAIIMISPSDKANIVCCDVTTTYVVNNCYSKGFGSVEILNIYSKLSENKFESTPENDQHILDACKRADTIILAWGKGQTKRSVKKRIADVVNMLSPYQEKLIEIADSKGKSGYHPLCAAVRLNWNLVSASITIEDSGS